MARQTIAAALSVALVLAGAIQADEVSLVPLKDNTLIESTGDPLSNGEGDGIYSGRTANLSAFTLRRAVLAFDVAASVPAGSTISSATLDLYMIRALDPGTAHTLHRLLAGWGEGTSLSFGGQGSPATPGDATWLHTFYPDQFWTSPGGDFVASPSGSAFVTAAVGTFTWGSTPQMVADVQSWLDDPGSNFGWVLIGDEVNVQTARKFGSRENLTPERWPRLTVQFVPSCALPGDINCDGFVNEIDRDLFVAVLIGTDTDPDHIMRCDLNKDSFANGADIALMVLALSGG